MPSEGWSTAPSPVPFDEATARLTPSQAALIERLLRRLIDLRPMRWTTLGTFAKRGLDRVDVERTVMALVDAGWIELHQRRDRTGDRSPSQLRLFEGAAEPATALLGAQSPSQRAQTIATLRTALEAMREAGGPPVPERVLVQRLFGQTKSVRLREYRTELEEPLGLPLEALVRFHVDLVLTAGPVRYRHRGVPVDLRGSSPWAAVTEPVATAATELVIEGVDELVCIENQTVFESLLYEGLADRAVVMFTAGYLGSAQRAWLAKVVGAGIRRVRHWGDLDPWGLDIYRHLEECVRALDPTVTVEPWRMSPEPLERPDAQRLTSEDWIALHRYLAREDAPLRETALAMKRLGRKLEQEALLGVSGE